MTKPLLRQITLDQLPEKGRDAVDAETLTAAAAIVDDVRARGEQALVEYAVRFGDLKQGDRLIFEKGELDAALESLAPDRRALLERTAQRIREFAKAQRESLMLFTHPIDGGIAGHDLAPVERAGCYAPGGRHPLPSSVLMTAITAKVAGVQSVWVASPRPTPVTLAAASLAGADAVLAVGGAQAIAALAYGAGKIPSCDAVVGPGNRYVTAAKQLVGGRVAIDMLAGPSELVILADGSADPAILAADLLAQAEHDPDAIPVLVTTDPEQIQKVETELERQLSDLPTANNARAALANGFALLATDLEEGIAVCNRLAPEHLEVMTEDPESARQGLNHYGALFLGARSAEVLGDYGAGPNHVLPTGGTARFAGGLSVFTFLRIRTWMRIDDSQQAEGLIEDAAALARLEGLEAHARAAEIRKGADTDDEIDPF